MQISCLFELGYVQHGGFRPLRSMYNTILYTGYDLLAKMASGEQYINGVYLEYMNGVPAEPTIAKTRTRAYYEALVAPYGFCRLPVSSKIFSSTGTEYVANAVTFEAVTDGTSVAGASIVDGSSQFFTVSLINMLSSFDRTLDTIYNAAPIKSAGVFAPIPKIANAQVGVRAKIQFEE